MISFIFGSFHRLYKYLYLYKQQNVFVNNIQNVYLPLTFTVVSCKMLFDSLLFRIKPEMFSSYDLNSINSKYINNFHIGRLSKWLFICPFLFALYFLMRHSIITISKYEHFLDSAFKAYMTLQNPVTKSIIFTETKTTYSRQVFRGCSVSH